MNEVATFFRNREQDPGETYQFQIRVERISYRFSVYSRQAMPSSALEDRQVANEKGFTVTFNDLLGAVASLGGGGLVVMTVDGGGLRPLRVDPVAASGYQPPRDFIVLAAGRPAYSQPVGKDLELPAGAHAIVPVDADAAQRLNNFMGYLPWFSPDLEALVLNAIRRPSLDARLNKVENRLFGQTAEAAMKEAGAGRWARMKGRLRRAMAKPATYGFGAAILLALLLGANAFLLYRLDSRIEKPPADTESSDSTDSAAGGTTGGETGGTVVAGGGGGTAELQEAPAFVGEVKELLVRLREKSASDPNLKLLYETHFKDFDKTDLTDQEIAAWFNKQNPPRGQTGSRPLLWGIIKVQALKLQPDPADKKFLQGRDEITATKEVFSGIGQDEIKKDADGLGLLAAVACRLGYNTPKAPGLPEISETSPQLEFVPGGKCEDYTAADIEKGLTGLVEFVEGR